MNGEGWGRGGARRGWTRSRKQRMEKDDGAAALGRGEGKGCLIGGENCDSRGWVTNFHGEKSSSKRAQVFCCIQFFLVAENFLPS